MNLFQICPYLDLSFIFSQENMVTVFWNEKENAKISPSKRKEITKQNSQSKWFTTVAQLSHCIILHFSSDPKFLRGKCVIIYPLLQIFYLKMKSGVECGAIIKMNKFEALKKSSCGVTPNENLISLIIFF